MRPAFLSRSYSELIVLILKAVGIFSALLAICSVFLSLVSGAGIIVALIALVLSGISAIAGDIRYAAFTTVVVTIDLFFVSVLLQIQDPPVIAIVLLIAVPYVITFVLIGIGIRRKRKASHSR